MNTARKLVEIVDIVDTLRYRLAVIDATSSQLDIDFDRDAKTGASLLLADVRADTQRVSVLLTKVIKEVRDDTA